MDNKLSLYVGKTEAIICESKRKLKKKNYKTLKRNAVSGVSIKLVSAVKYLGINIDSDMSAESSWKTIVRICNSALKFLYREAGCSPTATKETLYLVLTQCDFDYSVSSWYPSMSQTDKKKLQVVQNKLIRFMLNLGLRDHVTTKHTYFVKCGGQG